MKLERLESRLLLSRTPQAPLAIELPKDSEPIEVLCQTPWGQPEVNCEWKDLFDDAPDPTEHWHHFDSPENTRLVGSVWQSWQYDGRVGIETYDSDGELLSSGTVFDVRLVEGERAYFRTFLTSGEHEEHSMLWDLVDEVSSAGDVNLDENVDARDLNQIGRFWGWQDDVNWRRGDLTGDGRVDSADLNQLALNWKRGVGD